MVVITPLRNGTLLVEQEEQGCISPLTLFEVEKGIQEQLGLPIDGFYLTRRGDGKLISEESAEGYDGGIIIVPRVCGGKGGFGSMLRAIGAQIEKTTNRDACRDLSGRRLRDINEEQRLKRWFAKQKEREEQKAEAKKKKLEKLKQLTEGPPLPKIDDPEYNRVRAEMADKVYDAVDQGFEHAVIKKKEETITGSDQEEEEASKDSSSSSDQQEPSSSSSSSVPTPVVPLPGPSSTSTSTSTTTTTGEPKKHKVFKKTMFDEDLDSCSSSESEDEDETAPKKKAKLEN